jgi:hypothetical protein
MRRHYETVKTRVGAAGNIACRTAIIVNTAETDFMLLPRWFPFKKVEGLAVKQYFVLLFLG